MVLKLSALAIVFIFWLEAGAQEFKKFRVSAGAGYATGSGYSSGGVIATVEPGYRISDRLTLGLRGEVAAIARGYLNSASVDLDVSAVRSLTLNGIHYFMGDVIRPLAGVGAGLYLLSGMEYKIGVSGPSEEKGKDSKFGFYPRIGAELGHVSFTIDYNIVPKTTLPDGAEFRNSYVSFRLGVFFGGGRKKEISDW